MKKNKGFTLIEVLAVLVILSLLITFSVVSVNKIKKKQEVANRINVIRSILTAARAYEADYPNTNGRIGVKVNELLSKNYVDFDTTKYVEFVNEKVYWSSNSTNVKRQFYLENIRINTSEIKNISDCGLETEQSDNSNIVEGKELCLPSTCYNGKCGGWKKNGKYYSRSNGYDKTYDFK